MSLDDNIKNAFEVVHKTLESTKKLMEYCDSIAKKHGYVPVTSKFLRHKTDNNVKGWVLDMTIKLYQRSSDEVLKNQWRNGPVFALEINFEDMPCYKLSMFEYEDTSKWKKGISPADWWCFYFPTDIKDGRHKFEQLDKVYTRSTPNVRYKGIYRGLEKVTFMKGNLTDISVNNVGEKIFKEFDNLAER